jgi:glycosyltransferase involved in cell wall biosynthesis
VRILYVCTDADIGGAERLLALLGRHADARDVTRLVVLMQRGTLSDELDAAFDSVVYLNTPASSRNVIGMVRKINAQIREFEPAVVSSHLFHADLVTALARTKAPRTTTVHTHGFGAGDHPLTKLIARAVGALSFRFEAVIPSSDSPDMARFIRALRMRHVRTPILNGAEIPPAPTFDPAARRFLSLARNHPVKGHDVLFGAFADIAKQIPEWTLKAYGPGVVPDDPRMIEVLREVGAAQLAADGRITLAGPTSQPDEALAGSAALIISSLYGETSPLVGAESAGHGVPVITSDIGNCRQFADDARFVVAPGDRAALATAMLQYARMSDTDRSALSHTARSRAETLYRPDRVAASYRAQFAELVHP